MGARQCVQTTTHHPSAVKCTLMTIGFSVIQTHAYTKPSHHDVISSSLSDTLLMGDCKGKTQAEEHTHQSPSGHLSCLLSLSNLPQRIVSDKADEFQTHIFFFSLTES